MDIWTVLMFGLKVIVGFVPLWVFVGLIAVVCEVKWGFPIGILPPPKEYSDDKERKLRKSIVIKSIRKNIVGDILRGPLMFLLEVIACLFFCIDTAARYIFILSARRMANSLFVRSLSPLMFLLIMLVVILIYILASLLPHL